MDLEQLKLKRINKSVKRIIIDSKDFNKTKTDRLQHESLMDFCNLVRFQIKDPNLGLHKTYIKLEELRKSN